MDFWGQFWTFSFFHHFNTKVYIFLQHFVETFPGLRFGRSFFWSSLFLSIVHIVNWPQVFKISNLYCYLYQMALDHFRGHIWNQHTMLVTILREKLEDPKYYQPPTHPSIHPDKGFRRFEIDELRCFWNMPQNLEDRHVERIGRVRSHLPWG